MSNFNLNIYNDINNNVELTDTIPISKALIDQSETFSNQVGDNDDKVNVDILPIINLEKTTKELIEKVNEFAKHYENEPKFKKSEKMDRNNFTDWEREFFKLDKNGCILEKEFNYLANITCLADALEYERFIDYVCKIHANLLVNWDVGTIYKLHELNCKYTDEQVKEIQEKYEFIFTDEDIEKQKKECPQMFCNPHSFNVNDNPKKKLKIMEVVN